MPIDVEQVESERAREKGKEGRKTKVSVPVLSFVDGACYPPLDDRRPRLSRANVTKFVERDAGTLDHRQVGSSRSGRIGSRRRDGLAAAVVVVLKTVVFLTWLRSLRHIVGGVWRWPKWRNERDWGLESRVPVQSCRHTDTRVDKEATEKLKKRREGSQSIRALMPPLEVLMWLDGCDFRCAHPSERRRTRPLFVSVRARQTR